MVSRLIVYTTTHFCIAFHERRTPSDDDEFQPLTSASTLPPPMYSCEELLSRDFITYFYLHHNMHRFGILVLLWRVASQAGSAAALQTTTTSAFRIRPVASWTDVLALANLRYDEWIKPYYADTTSRAGFQTATAEILEERAQQGAVAFLAALREDDQDGTIVGAAELSPVELQGTSKRENENNDSSYSTIRILYVTDVVTSKNHRRKGVAQALMMKMEEVAADKGCSNLLLHVEPSNDAALRFYQSKLGYCEPDEEILASLDVHRLAQNAGTKGQILLGKTVTARLKQSTVQTPFKNMPGQGFGSRRQKQTTDDKKRQRGFGRK